MHLLPFADKLAPWFDDYGALGRLSELGLWETKGRCETGMVRETGELSSLKIRRGAGNGRGNRSVARKGALAFSLCCIQRAIKQI